MKHPALTVLTSLVFILAKIDATLCQSQPATPQSSPQAEKMKWQVEKIGVGETLTVSLITGQKYHGTVASIGADQFDIAEVDLKRIVTAKYSDVKSVSKGYGKKNIWGKRISPRTNMIVGIAVAAGIIGLGVWGASQTR